MKKEFYVKPLAEVVVLNLEQNLLTGSSWDSSASRSSYSSRPSNCPCKTCPYGK